MDGLRQEFEDDLVLLARSSRDVLEIARRRALAPVGWSYDEFYAGGLLYLVDLAKRAGREHAPDLAVLLAFAKGSLALSREYGAAVVLDARSIRAHDLFLVRTMADVNRALLRLEREPVRTFAELVEALDEGLPEGRIPLEGVVRAVRERALEAAGERPAGEVEAARREVLTLLAHVQLALGIMLKWNLVAQDRWHQLGGGERRLAELRQEYVGPILEALSPLEKLLRRLAPG